MAKIDPILEAKFQEKRNEAAAETAAIVQRAKEENRPLTDEEKEDFIRLDTEVHRWDHWDPRQQRTGYRFRDPSGREYRALLAHEKLCREPQRCSVGECLHAVLTNSVDRLDPELRVAMLGGSDSGGGYLLAPTLGASVIDLARSASVAIRAGAQTLPIEGETNLARVSGDPTGYWRGETVEVTSSSVTFERVKLIPKTLAAIVPVSIELLEDAPNAADIIEQTLQRALGLKLDQAVIDGAGSAEEPLGIRNSGSVNTVTSVGTPTDYSEVSNAVMEVLTDNYAGELSGLSWIQHPRDANVIDKLVGSGDGQPLQPTPMVGQLQRFMTTTVDITEGGGSNESYGIVGDFSQVLIGLRSNVVIRIADDGSVTDSDSATWNATSQLMRHIVAYLRADVALLHPDHFTVLSGITST